MQGRTHPGGSRLATPVEKAGLDLNGRGLSAQIQAPGGIRETERLAVHADLGAMDRDTVLVHDENPSAPTALEGHVCEEPTLALGQEALLSAIRRAKAASGDGPFQAPRAGRVA